MKPNTAPERHDSDFDPIIEATRQWKAHGYADAAAGMAFVTSLMRSHQLMLARIDAVLRPLNLTFARYELLTLLAFSKTGALPMSVISKRLQVHPTSTTNAVDRLEAAGLVLRKPHPRDGRTTLVELLDTGRTLSEQATVALNSEVFEHPGLSTADLNTALDVLGRHRSNNLL